MTGYGPPDDPSEAPTGYYDYSGAAEGETPPGGPPWYRKPIFSLIIGLFVAILLGLAIYLIAEKTNGHGSSTPTPTSPTTPTGTTTTATTATTPEPTTTEPIAPAPTTTMTVPPSTTESTSAAPTTTTATDDGHHHHHHHDGGMP